MAMNRRQVIEAARDHLLRQGCFGRSGYGGCVYLNDEGYRCAIGGLPGFPESAAKSTYTIDKLIVSNSEVASLFDETCDAQFLYDVQRRLHDNFVAYGIPYDAVRISSTADELLAEWC